MAISINDFRMAIRIDNSEAKAKFAETKEQVASVTAEMKKLEAEGKKNSEEYKALKQRQDELNKSLAAQRKETGLCSLSYTELRKGAAQLKREMDKAVPGTEQWKALRADYLLTKNRMKELSVQANETRFSLSKVADGFNKYAAIGAGAIASLTGVAMTARKCVDEYAEMQEAESQVRKYTGMMREEIAALNEEFKAMDTRTAREKLNALAGDAGRLGITGKKEVLEFVDAADKINVALGEDLGEDAVKNIGKLAQMFGEDEKMGLRGAMLATGSAINEVAQNSSAAEAYLVAFTARVAGAANQAKVSQSDILGYASVLDQNMQQQEMAATAFQTLMMKMYQEPAKFAKITGQSVKDFTALIKEDANEALLQLLSTLNKKGGLDKLAPMFKEMGLDGVRASGVISTMAGKIDDIREAQQLANNAYQDGTSIINEFNVQNNTVQAGLDKAKKKFKDVRIELGEQLLPVMKHMVSTGTLTVKTLKLVISVLFEYKNLIFTAITVVTAYTVVSKLQWFWLNKVKSETGQYIVIQKLKQFWDKAVAASTWLYIAATSVLTGKTRQAGLSMEAFFKILKLNPFTSIATLIIAVAGALYFYSRRASEATRAQTLLNDISSEAKANIISEKTEVEALLKVAKDEKRSKGERLKAIRKLNEISPEYLGNLNLEKIGTDEAKKSVDKYIESLMVLAEVESVKTRLTDTDKQLSELKGKEQEYLNERNSFWGAVKNIPRNIGSMLSFGVVENTGEKLTKDIETLERQREQLKSLLKGLVQDQIAVEAEKTNGGDGDGKCSVCGNKPCTCNKDVDAAMKAREAMLKQAMQDEQNKWKEEYLNKQHTEQEYQQALYDSEMMFLLKKKALLESYGKDSTEIQGQIYDKMIAEANRLTIEKKKAEEDANKKTAEDKKKSFSVLDSTYQQDQQSIKKAYLDGDIKTEKEYQDKMNELEFDYLEQRKQMLIAYGDDVSAINGQILDKQVKQKKTDTDEKRKEGFAAIKNETDYGKQLDMLQAMRDADLISYEEYEKTKTQITEGQESAREEKTKAVLQTIGQAMSAASQVVSALQDAEISKVTRKYDKQIAAAKKAGKDTTKLEEEKEEAINGVKKKYADKQFAASVLQITASTAVAAMEAYKAMAGIPIVGPVLGGIAAAAAVASGAAQIAVAKQTRDEAKGLKSGGYSGDYVEGYTRNGNPDDVAGVIPVHKNEFVTNHEGVANPHVRQFLDVFDVAQKTGTIRMINTTQILEQVRTRSGKYNGGYNEESSSSSQSFVGTSTEVTPNLRSQIVDLLVETNKLLVDIRNKDLIVDPRKVRDGIKNVERLERNVSRG